ncbi:hypothetical protein CALVIDRAFT_564156 [Calocera viscosa TUFC12733]|uniref:Uncharacterized protein n=1 Tax=Calocera viscosa (strain TUFC12733) TaxID=1330018 RepID=A0A167M367_CALVF|nr:hypothetical protein CALVIDRAFT_564156 [Calocera viscosa TUFC12733]
MFGGITHITKDDFFPAFYRSFQCSFTVQNIKSGFRGAGLVPFNPDAVLAKLPARCQGTSLCGAPQPLSLPATGPKLAGTAIGLRQARQCGMTKMTLANIGDKSDTYGNQGPGTCRTCSDSATPCGTTPRLSATTTGPHGMTG